MLSSFAVIGKPITHSLSPMIHQHFAKQTNIQLTYEPILGDEHTFAEQVITFFNQNGKGLNITLPFKERAFALARQKTPRCLQAKAANTLWFANEQIHADNTDGIGLVRDLMRYMPLQGKKILILGAGGAARGIIHPLLAMNPANLTFVNRTEHKLMALKADFPAIQCSTLEHLNGDYDLIINATSASIDNQAILLPAEIIRSKPFCYDLAYAQKGVTPFVCYAQDLGLQAIDGLGMLVEQAAEAFFIWHGVMPETKFVLDQLYLRKKSSNDVR